MSASRRLRGVICAIAVLLCCAGSNSPTPTRSPLYAWTTWVANEGGQAEVDECTGGLTHVIEPSWKSYEYYPIHRHCGGNPILELRLGDLINIEQQGIYRVADSRVGHIKEEAAWIKELWFPGAIFLQTCYPNNHDVRVVVAAPIDAHI